MEENVKSHKTVESRSDVVRKVLDINAETQLQHDGMTHQLRRLVQAISNLNGRFGLFFAVCNNRNKQRELTQEVMRELKNSGEEVFLTGKEASFLDVLMSKKNAPQPLFVYGIEELLPSSDSHRIIFERTIAELQLRREQFRQLNRPIILWMPEYAYTLIGQKAVDFWSWQSGGFFFEGYPSHMPRNALLGSNLMLLDRDYSIPDFVGRENDLLTLADNVRSGSPVCIVGMGGIGKTALALQLADRMKGDFPDGQLFIQLSNEARGDVVNGLRTAVQQLEPIANIPETPSELIALYRELLSGKRILVVVDGLDDPSELRHFLTPRDSSLIVTSRRPIRAFGALNFQLDVLNPSDARALLLSIVPGISIDDADAICFHCNYLPLAIVLAGGLLATNRLTSDDLLKSLRKHPKGSEETQIATLDSVLSLAYHKMSPLAKTVFRELSIFPSSFATDAERSICEDPYSRGLAELIGANMVSNTSLLRHELHPALKSFASKRLAPSAKEATLIRHAKYYLDVLWKAGRLYDAGRDQTKEGIALFDLEWNNIQAGQAWTSRNLKKLPDVAAPLCVDYPNAGAHLLFLRRTPIEVIPWLESAIEAARILQNSEFEATHLGNLGNYLMAIGQRHEAIEKYQQALDLSRNTNDRTGEMLSLGNLGNAYHSLGKSKEAIEILQESLMIADAISDPSGRADTLSNLGNIYLHLGDVRRASDLFREALQIHMESGNIRGQAVQLLELGFADDTTGNHRAAIERFNEALSLAETIGDGRLQSAILDRLGRSYASLSESNSAIEHFEKQLELARQFGDKEIETNALGNLGNAYRDIGRMDSALTFLEHALRLAQQTENKKLESFALGNLGNLYQTMGISRRAIELYEQSLSVHRQFGDRIHEAKAIGSLANAYSALGDYRLAIDMYEQELSITREIGDRATEAKALGNMGIAYQKLGDLVRAEELYKQDLLIAREIGEIRGEAAVLSNLGGISAMRGDYARAIELFESALEKSRTIGDPGGESDRLNNLANVYAAQSDYQKALSLYQQSLSISRNLRDRRLQGTTLFNMAQAFNELGRTSEAKATAREALDVLVDIEDPTVEKVRSFLGRLN